MQLYIRQRVFSWSDSYDVYDESGQACYEVRAEILTLGHQIHVYEKSTGREVGTVRERFFTWMPVFDVEIEGQPYGQIRKRFSPFSPRYDVDYRGWEIEGDFLGWNYQVVHAGRTVMTIQKELFRWSDTYVLQSDDPADTLAGLMLVLAIDAANCGR